MIWESVKLGDVCDLQNGFAFKSNLFKEDGLPILRISNIQEDIISLEKLVYFSENDYSIDFERYKVHQNDLLIAMSGATTGKLGFNQSGKTFYLNQRVGKFLPHKTLNKKYLYYILSTKVEENLNISRGVAQPNLSTKQIKDIEFFLPPLSEQERIVAKLDAAFAEIDGTIEKAQAKVKEIKKFKDSIRTSMLNNNDWEDFELAEICTKITDGSHNPPKGVTFSDFLMLSSKNVFNDAINFEKPRFLKEEDYIKENKRTDVQEGDVLLTIVGTIGRCAVVNDSLKPFTLQRSVAVLKPAHDLVLSRFLMYSLQDMLQILLQGARGVAQKGIYLKSLRELKLKVPPLLEQRSIITKLDAIYGQVDSFKDCISNNKENYKALKSAILAQELQSSEAA